MATAGGQVLLTDGSSFPVVTGNVEWRRRRCRLRDGQRRPERLRGSARSERDEHVQRQPRRRRRGHRRQQRRLHACTPSPDACDCTGAGARTGLVAIAEVQGNGFTTPYLDRTVTVQGVSPRATRPAGSTASSSRPPAPTPRRHSGRLRRDLRLRWRQRHHLLPRGR